jgi:N-acetylglucosamine-6-sulfatase
MPRYRDLMVKIAAVALLVLAAPAMAQPNIVVIVADDLDQSLFTRMYLEGYLPTIRSYIGDRGTIFRNSFVTTSLCCPARATLLTGQYSHNHNVLDNLKPLGGVTKFNASTALPVWLKGGNYITGLVGKYLNGYGADGSQPLSSPENPGHIPSGWDFWRALTTNEMYGYNVTQWDSVSKTTKLATYSEYQTDKLAQMAANFIAGVEQYDARPFFLLLAPFAPHEDEGGGATTSCASKLWRNVVTPSAFYLGTMAHYFGSLPQPPSYNEADVADKPAFIQAFPQLTAEEVDCARLQYQLRAEAMRSVDDMVQTVVNALITHGELADTILVFTSDNGYSLGEHRLCCKISGYEEAIRVPLLMSGPGIPVGVIDALVLNNDLAPTFAAWAGVTPAVAVDGRSLLPLLQNPGTPWRKRFLVEYLGEAHPPIPKFQAVRTGPQDSVPRAYFVAWQEATPSREFYELATDPHQIDSTHLLDATASKRATLQQYLNRLGNCGKIGQPTCRDAED